MISTVYVADIITVYNISAKGKMLIRTVTISILKNGKVVA
jgi:hypothetical protein